MSSQRSTGDLLILGIAATVCAVIVLVVLIIGVVEIVHPDQDTSAGAGLIVNILNTLVGVVAGYLAGRTDRTARTDSDET